MMKPMREAAGGALGGGGGRIGVLDPRHQRRIDRHVAVAREVEKALGEVGVVGLERGLDLAAGDAALNERSSAWSARRSGIVLRREQRFGLDAARHHGQRRDRAGKAAPAARRCASRPCWSCLLRAAPAQNWYCRDCASKMPGRQIIRFDRQPNGRRAPAGSGKALSDPRIARFNPRNSASPGRYGAAHVAGCRKSTHPAQVSCAALPFGSDHGGKHVPHFHNTPGVPVIEIGAREFMCVGEVPPFDHPHVFLDMGDADEIICPYCSTLFRYDAEPRSA